MERCGDEALLECWICKKRVMEGWDAGEMFYCSTFCLASDATLTPLEALTARRTDESQIEDANEGISWAR